MYIILSFRSGSFRASDRLRVIYKNGVAQWSDYSPVILSITGILTIGAYIDNAYPNEINSPLKGSIDQFRFWKRTLTNTEISNVFTNVKLVSTTSIYFAYEFDSTTSIVYDYSGFSRDLTVGTGAIYEQDNSLCVNIKI
jgi:hypothetical protein